MDKPTLYLMMGLPGAGKTTIAKIIADITGATHISSDFVRLDMFEKPSFSQEEHDKLYHELDTQTESLLNQGKSVVYDANLNRHEHRQEKYDICAKTGAKSQLIWVKTDRETSKDRATHTKRFMLWPKDESPKEMFDRVSNTIEEPLASEGHIAIEGEGITPEIVRQKLDL